MPLFALALILFAAPAAQEMPMKPVTCPADAEPIPAELTPWKNPAPLAAATNAQGMAAAQLMPGAAVTLALAPTSAVRFALRPEHPGGSVAHGGMARLHIESAGSYRVAIGSGAWLDLVRDGVSQGSSGHGHGPNCSGIRKMVDFMLQPGDYVLQVSGNAGESLAVLVAKLPG